MAEGSVQNIRQPQEVSYRATQWVHVCHHDNHRAAYACLPPLVSQWTLPRLLPTHRAALGAQLDADLDLHMQRAGTKQ